MTAQSAGAVVAPGGAVPDDEARGTMCEAYRQAFEDYCKIPRIVKRGKFNDYFFQRMGEMRSPPATAAMAQQAADMAGNIMREVPMLVDVGANGVGTAAQLASTAAGQPGVVGAIGGAFVTATQTAAMGITGGASGVVTGLTTTAAAIGHQIRSCVGLAGYFAQAGLDDGADHVGGDRAVNDDPLFVTRGSAVVRPVLAAYFHLERLREEHAPMLVAAVEALASWLGPPFALTESSVFPVPESSTRAHLDYVPGRALATRARLHPMPQLQGIFNVDAKLLRDDFWSTIGTVSEVDPQQPVYSSFFFNVPCTTPLADFEAAVNAIAAALPLRWGSAGLSYAWARPSWRAATEFMRTHARRYPGFHPGFHHRSLEYLHERIRTINWLTYLGDGFVSERPELRQRIATGAPGVALKAVGNNLALRAGEQPQAGDANRLVLPREYVAVDEIVRPARASEGDRVTFIGPWSTAEIAGWLRRFERVLPSGATRVKLEPTNRSAAKVLAFPIKDLEHRDNMAVIARRAFRLLDDGAVEDASADVAIDLVDTYHGKDGVSSIRRPSMLFAFKPGTDVILLGQAHPPQSGAESTDVHLRVGPIDKTVRAYGTRAWRSGSFGGIAPGPAAAMREPVPLVYELAWGGQDLSNPERPLGEPRNYLGRARHTKSLIGQPATQLEYPSGAVTVPAAFNPIHRHWQPRASFAGKYDECWMETRLPLLPRDFNDRFHVSVPDDQWSVTPLRGDESFKITNATPEGTLRFQLPRFAPGFTSIVEGQQRQHRTHLDTILIDADARVVELTWRACVPLPRKLEMVDRITVLGKQVV